MSELIECLDGLRAEDILRRIAKSGFYLQTKGLSSGIVPSDLPNLGIWLLSDTGVTQVGGLVSLWEDQSGNGVNASQGVDGNKPTILTNQLNSYPAISFDGIDNFLTWAGPLAASGTLFFVAYTISTTEYIYGRTSNNNYYFYTHATSPVWKTVDTQTFTFASDHSKYFIWELVKDGNNKYVFRNGVGSVSNPQVSASSFYLGEHIGRMTTVYGEYKLVELIYYSDAKSDADRTLIRDYLNTKYAIY